MYNDVRVTSEIEPNSYYFEQYLLDMSRFIDKDDDDLNNALVEAYYELNPID